MTKIDCFLLSKIFFVFYAVSASWSINSSISSRDWEASHIYDLSSQFTIYIIALVLGINFFQFWNIELPSSHTLKVYSWIFRFNLSKPIVGYVYTIISSISATSLTRLSLSISFLLFSNNWFWFLVKKWSSYDLPVSARPRISTSISFCDIFKKIIIKLK